MLKAMRAAGFVAPVAVGALIAVIGPRAAGLPAAERSQLLAAVILGSVAGLTTMAVIAWLAYAGRLDRIARALEATLHSEAPGEIPVRGVPGERRLAAAFNAAAGAFLEVEAKATRDRLTGVANRETLLTALMAEVERANRYRAPLSVAFIDIDRFKPINDTHGHNSGDAVLRQVADLVGRNVRAADLLGRYGGEEFMLILPETDPEAAVELAEQLRALVMQTPLRIADGATLRATISIGIAGGRGGELRLDALVQDADAAMYSAKSLGRNQTYVFRTVAEEARVRRAPVSPQRRQQAAAVGRWAGATATRALASVLAPHPHHRGRPSDMIAALATGLAEQMRLPDADIEQIRIASLLHDLGKLAIPHEILDKPTSLDESEWQTITEHPRIGQLIIEQATSLRDAVPIVLHHHERYNGRGYPHGLKGREIPLGARIVAVADAYHAIVHDRPYQKARGHEEALAELRRHAGTQFDPEVVALFCELYADAVPEEGSGELQRLHEETHGEVEHAGRHNGETHGLAHAEVAHAEVAHAQRPSGFGLRREGGAEPVAETTA